MDAKSGKLSWADEAEITVCEGGACCYVMVCAGVEGWQFRTRKWFFCRGEPIFDPNESLTLAIWDALDLCEIMGWAPRDIRWRVLYAPYEYENRECLCL